MNKASIKEPAIPWAAILRLGAAAAGALLLALMGCELMNNPPSIDIVVEDDTPLTGSTQTFTAVVEDLDEDLVFITWSATDGEFNKMTGEVVKWAAPSSIGKVLVSAVADDRKARGTDTATVSLSVVNSAPSITKFIGSAPYVTLGNSVTLSCEAFDPDGEDIIFDFFTSPADVGTMLHESPEASTATWTAPSDPNLARTYDLIVTVSDVPQGYYSSDTLQVLVFSENGTIWIVDGAHREVTKYTSRGEKILTSSHPFSKPVAVASNIDESYGCYVADQDAGEISKLDALGQNVQAYSGIPNVVDVAIHRTTRTIWAVSVGDNALTVLNGYTHTQIKKVYGLVQPTALTINQSLGDVWIADTGNDRVIRLNIGDLTADELLTQLPDTISSSTATIFEGDFNGPVDLSVQELGNFTLYIADRYDNEVERLSYNSTAGTYSRGQPVTDFDEPTRVIATSGNLVWVLNSTSIGSSLQYFLDEPFQPPETIGAYLFSKPHAMAIDPVTGNVWIGDNGRHQVVEISSADSVGVKISGFSFVEDIVVNK